MSETPDIAAAVAGGKLVPGSCIACGGKIAEVLTRLGSIRCHDCRRTEAAERFTKFSERLQGRSEPRSRFETQRTKEERDATPDRGPRADPAH